MGSAAELSFANLSLENSAVTEETTSSRKTRGTSANATRAHCRLPRPDEPERKNKSRLFYCKYCTETYTCQASNTFRGYLAKQHNIFVEEEPGAIAKSIVEQLEQLYLNATLAEQTEKIDVQVLRKVLDKEVITEALIMLIVPQNLSFRIVE